MPYLIILAIVAIVIILIFRFVKSIISGIIDFIKEFPYLTWSVVMILIAAFRWGIKWAFFTAFTVIVLKIIYVGFKQIIKYNKKRNEDKLYKYLKKEYSFAGYIQLESIVLPRRYINAGYPDDITYQEIVDDFLKRETENAVSKLQDIVYEIIREKGMVQQDEVYNVAEKKLKQAVYNTPYQYLFSYVIKMLEVEHKVDRPADGDKNALRCVGVQRGSNLKRNEIEIEGLDI